MTWQAHVTVATIVEDQGRFLFVEEIKGGRAVLNQPAGTWTRTKACNVPPCVKPWKKPVGTSN